MKKMFLAATIVCVAAFSQAASVKWASVGMYSDAGSKVGSKATMYVYVLADQAAYDGLTDVWATYGEDVLKNNGAGAYNAGGTKTSLSKATVYAPDDGALPTTTYYAAIIATIGTGEDMKYFAEKKTVLTGEDGNGTGAFGVGTLDTAASAATAWKPAVDVPEPTSGLLLLVGGALLALRRKQK